MSASISCSARAKELLESLRRGGQPDRARVRALGEECTREFFGIVVESLADSFDAAESAIYENLMSAWIPGRTGFQPVQTQTKPGEARLRIDTVYVLSRVTLGADIKIVSPILSAMRRRFPKAQIALVSNRKSAELFEAERGIDFIKADYPRGGSMRDRIAFAERLREMLDTPHRIVIDPDSRMTQLGLIPAAEPERYFHLPSRTIGGETGANLTELVSDWLIRNFGEVGAAWIAPKPITIECARPMAAVSLGVGENANKRLGLDFEAGLIAALAERFSTIHIDRGFGGDETRRVTAAAEASGAMERVRFCEGSFAEFASVIARSDFYAGYDSAGQHAAAAAGTPLVSIFAGAPSKRFIQRWAPATGGTCVINAGGLTPEECLAEFRTKLSMLGTNRSGHR